MKNIYRNNKLKIFHRNNLFFLRIIFSPIKKLINFYLTKNNVFIIWRNGKAIGDQILMAGLAKIMNSKYNSKVIVISNYPILLSLSPWISSSISPKQIKFWSCIYYLLKLLEGKRIIEYNFPYRLFGYDNHLEAYNSGFYDQLNQPPIWHAHVADRFDIDIFSNFEGGLRRSNCSKAKLIIEETRRNCPEFKIGIINPIGKETYTKAKIYGFKNYQQIIDNTFKKIKWFQVGLNEDRLLKNISKDLRGNSLEFLVNIVSYSDLVLGDEGLLNHVAGSFPKVHSYVVFSEFSPPKYYSYKNTTTLGIPKNKAQINYWRKEKNKNLNSFYPTNIISQLIIEKEFPN